MKSPSGWSDFDSKMISLSRGLSSPRSSALGVASTSSMKPARARGGAKKDPPPVDVAIVVARAKASAREAWDARGLWDVIDVDDVDDDASASVIRACARERGPSRRVRVARARVVVGTARVVVERIVVVIARVAVCGVVDIT